MKAEAILWIDPHVTAETWTGLRDLCMDGTKVLTFGLVVKENDDTVAVANGTGIGNDDVLSVLILPKSAIIQRHVIASDDDVASWVK